MKKENGFSKMTIIVIAFILILIIVFSQTSKTNNNKSKNIMNEENKVAYSENISYPSIDDMDGVELDYNTVQTIEDIQNEMNNGQTMMTNGISIDDIKPVEAEIHVTK